MPRKNNKISRISEQNAEGYVQRSSRRNILKGISYATAGIAAAGAASLMSEKNIALAATSGLQVYDVKVYGAVGSGSGNDSPAIQAAINDAANAKGGIVWFPPGVYRLGAGLSVPDQVMLIGVGWETPVYNTSSTPANTPGNGSWLYVDSTAFIPITVYGRGSVIRDIAIAHLQPNPAAGWVPTSYPYAIAVKGDDIHLEGVFLRNPTRGIQIFNSPTGAIGRVTLDRIWGQPLLEGINIDYALDIIKINNVHFWPFWSDNANVASYTKANGTAITSLKNDGPHFSNIFVFRYNIGFLFGQSSKGVTLKFRITNADTDFCNRGIRIAGPNTTGQIVNYTAQGSPGVNGIHIEAAGVRLQACNIRVTDVGTNGIRVEGSGAIAFIETVWIEDWDKNQWGFPAIEVTSPAVVYVGKSRLFERGNGITTGGSGTIILD